jgi:hypothetical protein
MNLTSANLLKMCRIKINSLCVRDLVVREGQCFV